MASDLDASFNEERAVGFRVRDATGDIRVFPRGARWDAPVDLDEATGLMGDEPAGLRLRTGAAIAGTAARSRGCHRRAHDDAHRDTQHAVDPRGRPCAARPQPRASPAVPGGAV